MGAEGSVASASVVAMAAGTVAGVAVTVTEPATLEAGTKGREGLGSRGGN